LFRVFFLVLLTSCGTSTDAQSIKPRETSLCDYVVNNVCVAESNMNIDKDMLSWSFDVVEEEVNVFYPGLDLSSLAGENNLTLMYLWVSNLDPTRGKYSDSTVCMKVYLRNSSSMEPWMECMDRYFIAAHEMLHFIADRYLYFEYEDGDPHNVPGLFTNPEGEAAEDYIYSRIRVECGFE